MVPLKIALDVNEVAPVPPLFTAIVSADQVPVPIVPTLVNDEPTTELPKVVAFKTEVPAICKSFPDAKFIPPSSISNIFTSSTLNENLPASPLEDAVFVVKVTLSAVLFEFQCFSCRCAKGQRNIRVISIIINSKISAC